MLNLIILILIQAALLAGLINTPAICGYIQNTLGLPFHSAFIWLPLSILATVDFLFIFKYLAQIKPVGKCICANVERFGRIVNKLCASKKLVLCAGIFLLAFIICLAHMHYLTKYTYIDPDTQSYIFQARLFTMGKVYTQSPPNIRFIPCRPLNSMDGRVYHFNPPGAAFFLALGEYFNIPWIIPLILSGITALLIFLMMDSFVNRRAALLAVLLLLASPSFYAIGGAWWSENVSRLFLLISFYLFLKAIYNLSPQNALLSGICWSVAFNTRPMPGAVFGAVFVGWGIYSIIVSKDKKKLGLTAAAMFLGSLSGVLFFFYINHFYTGNMFMAAHDVEQKGAALGFGLKGEGVNPANLAYPIDYTPLVALKRTIKNVLPTVGINIAGWGLPENIYGFNFITAILAYVFIIYQVIKSKDRFSIILFLTFLVSVLFLFFFAYDPSVWHTLAVGARYYNESIIIGLIPLLAMGIISSRSYFEKISNKFNFPKYSLQFGLIILLAINVGLFTYAQFNYGYGARFWDLRQAVKEKRLKNAVVFVYNTGIPIGDLPYKEFGEGDVVYFRLFRKNSAWTLDQKDPSKDDDWREFYRKYFTDRMPYLWDRGKLVELDEQL